MGWWGYELFAGDSPLDWICGMEKNLEEQIDKTIEKGYHDGQDTEDIPAMIFFYADFLRRYSRKVGKLHAYAKWLRTHAKDIREENPRGWQSKEERANTLERLAEQIETLFSKEEDGYKNPKNYPKINIAGKRVYHLTKRESLYKDASDSLRAEDTPLQGILTQGLKPQRCFSGFIENKHGIYVSSSLMGALKWQFHVLSHDLLPEPALVSFVIDDRDEVYQDLRVDFKDDYVICNEISTNRLTIFA